ncbi:MAG: NAD(+) diphosphatase [Pseudomonadota bacterium]
MKDAEAVTFGGSGLERRAELRGDSDALDRMARDPSARHYPLWRGKPLVAGEARDRGAHVPHDAPILAEAGEKSVFLGTNDGVPLFAHDISSWDPPDLDSATLGAFLDPTEQHYPGLPDDHRFAELRAIMTRLSPRDAELLATAKAVLGWHTTHQFCSRCGAPSFSAKGGWQRDCPACGAHHFPRTDPVVIMLITHGNSVLVGRSPQWPEGMYSLLAGFVEPGEPIEAAVRREVFEESGVLVGEVTYLSSQPWPFPASLMFGCHGHALTQEIRIDHEELEDARWVTRETMLDVLAGRDLTMKPARKGAIARFLIERWLSDTLA